MLDVLLLTTALGAPPLATEPVRVRRVRDVGLDADARPVGREGRGPWRVWTVPDGRAVMARRVEDGVVVQQHRWDGGLAPHTHTSFTDGAPRQVHVVGAPAEIDVSAWQRVEMGAVALVVPDPPDASGQLTTTQGRWTLAWDVGGADPWATDWVARLEAGAGGRRLADALTWIDGAPARRVTLALPDPARSRVAEVWAVPRGDTSFVFTFTATAGTAPASLDTLAPGRAVAALIQWTDE